ncbi:hypothetical protein PGB90_002747 [Kerria lacca]
MKILLLLCVFFIVVANAVSFINFEEWDLFKMQFKKLYETEMEEGFRKKIFLENKRKIIIHNKLYEAGEVSYKLAMNHFGDMLHHEFTKMMNGYKRNMSKIHKNEAVTFIVPYNVSLPNSVDWRTDGAVTEVKNQGQCGSCWSFSATGALEGQHFRKTGHLVSLSEQNLIDCSKSFGNNGCEGGLMDNAFKYVEYNKGIDTEISYPYKGKLEKCHYKKNDIGAIDTGFVDIPEGDEQKLKTAVATVGPVSVAIDASHESFQFYSEGIYYEKKCSSTELDHGVLVIGYDTSDNGQDYWVVKNSWGKSWGIQGYIKMARNENNNCGIATDASYPLV